METPGKFLMVLVPMKAPTEEPQQSFPLMKLPPELRNMVYREILRPTTYIDTDPYDDKPKLAIAIQDTKHRANFLVANKQINTEATQIWWNKHYFKATVCGWSTHIELQEVGFSASRSYPFPSYMPKIHNLEISLPHQFWWGTSCGMPLGISIGVHSNLAGLCKEIARQVPDLRNVIVEVPCKCHMSDNERDRYHPSSWPVPGECHTFEAFQKMLGPLKYLRVSQRFMLRSACKGQDLKRAFNEVSAEVRSSAPVDLGFEYGFFLESGR